MHVALHHYNENIMPMEAIEVYTNFLLSMVQVWGALLENMPMTAMIRNLGKMSALDLLKPRSSHSNHICNRLKDYSLLSKVLHPIHVLGSISRYMHQLQRFH